tara:strand:+ start:386 stop:556 length:171 start_codon:yes stop_codon:yes gene_type:complete
MGNAKDLTNNQKETLKKLLLKQKEWEKSKAAIKTAKKTNKPTKKTNQTKKPKTVRV